MRLFCAHSLQVLSWHWHAALRNNLGSAWESILMVLLPFFSSCIAKEQEPNPKHSRRRAANTSAQGNTEGTASQAETKYGRVAS